MNRREFTTALSAVCAGVLAGCLGDDGQEAEPTPATETPTEESPTPTASPTPETEESPTPTASPTPETDEEAEADVPGPAAVADAFLQTVGDAQQRTQYLDPSYENPDELRLAEIETARISVASLTVAEKQADSAVVAVELAPETSDPLGRLERIELRRRDDGWKISGLVVQPGPPTAEFTIDGEGESVVLTHAQGDPVPADRLFVRSPALAETGSWERLGGERVARRGDTITVSGADSPATVEILWQRADGEASAVLASTTVELPALEQTVPDAVAEYLADANGHDEVVDRTDTDEVSVVVGGGDDYAFEPAGVRISPGTTIVWEWSDSGISHNVVADDGRFESELVAEAGHTFRHTFEESGSYLYYCYPHRISGMKGAVIVE